MWGLKECEDGGEEKDGRNFKKCIRKDGGGRGRVEKGCGKNGDDILRKGSEKKKCNGREKEVGGNGYILLRKDGWEGRKEKRFILSKFWKCDWIKRLGSEDFKREDWKWRKS